MVTVSHRVTDVSQVKFHAQDPDGICVSFKEGEWIWLAKEVASHLSTMLDLIPMGNDLMMMKDQDIEESDYEVSYRLPDSHETYKMTVQAISEGEAMVIFYENAPEEYKAQLTNVEISKKD